MAARYDSRAHAYEDQARHSGMVYVLMLVVALAFGGLVWQLYSAPEIPHIAAAPGPYKVEGASARVEPVIEAGVAEPEPAAETPLDQVAETIPMGAPHLAPAPSFVAEGPYVAQLAALQSEAAVDPAWRRLSSRAPGLFASARLDVERADLGQRGIYYRVRAGYFADRANAARFCERIRQMGQDCIATAR